MKHVLVYGDSLSWGILPGTRQRLPFAQRWPGVLEAVLNESGSFRVSENCLNGRRTVLQDPFKPGRHGAVGLEQVIEMHSPLDILVLCLGTNDFQSVHQFNARQAAQGVRTLVDTIRRAPIEPGMAIPSILLLAPPPIREVPGGPLVDKFENAAAKAEGFASQLAAVAAESSCLFLDAGRSVATSSIDGVHLDADAHQRLGHEVAVYLLGIDSITASA